jgi:AraC family transcriptional regulator
LISTAAERYRAKFRSVLDYIDAHLDETLDVARLSNVAAFSQFHFHRQFTAFCGIGAYKYVQLQRLKRAAYQLAFRNDLQIITIALASGYDGPEAFARAFKKGLGQSPAQFRKEPRWSPWYAIYQPLSKLRIQHMSHEYSAEQVSIVDFKTTKVAALEYRGDCKLIGNAVRKFIEWRKQQHLPPRVSATFNIVYAHSDDGDCHYDLCATTERDVGESPFGVVSKIIPGGRCAVLRHIGSEDTLASAVNYLYSQWLPHSGEEVRDFPLYLQRVSFFPDVPEHQAIVDIFLPLRNL